MKRGILVHVGESAHKRHLIKWYTGSYDDIVDVKKGYMQVDEFENILEKFPLAFDSGTPLCKEIQLILLPLLKSGALFTGTLSGSSKDSYDLIIEVFDSAIAGMV